MIKKKLGLFLFFYVLCFLAIPPIVYQFFDERKNEIFAQYSASTFFLCGISIVIYVSALKGKIFNTEIECEKQAFFIYSSSALICFGILCISSVLFELISFFFNINSGIHNVLFPSSISGWINFFSGVIFTAFFEEIVYRFYLPEALKDFFIKENSKNQKLSIICEISALLLFAFGHVYLGILGFLNAVFCGIALRICMIKTKTIYVSFAVHAIYNVLSFLIIKLIGNA